MKILVFADPHGNKKSLKKVYKKAKDADLVISVGDFTLFEDRIKDIMREMDSLGKKVLVIHGNHEDEIITKKICDKSKNLIFIHDGFYKTDDYTFLGFGGGGFSQRDSHFEGRKKLYKQVIKDSKLYMVVHQPPYSTTPDLVGKEHTGSKSFREFIKKYQPEIVFCGHIHEGFGKEDKIGKTRIINPGPEGMFFEI